jgi:phosphoglycolate phosphatase
MTTLRYEILLFDLDGTLTDPLEGISRSINHALVHFGYPSREMAELAVYVGPPLDQAFKELTGSSEDEHLRELVTKYRERYGDIGFSENKLYPGVAEVLACLYDACVPMALCTSKRDDFAKRILELFSLQDYFLFVSGGDIGVHKWQQLELLLAREKISRSSLMIGDRAVDLIAAHRNGLQSAGVLWGYGSREELLSENPAHLFDMPSDWLKLI